MLLEHSNVAGKVPTEIFDTGVPSLDVQNIRNFSIPMQCNIILSLGLGVL